MCRMGKRKWHNMNVSSLLSVILNFDTWWMVMMIIIHTSPNFEKKLKIPFSPQKVLKQVLVSWHHNKFIFNYYNIIPKSTSQKGDNLLQLSIACTLLKSIANICLTLLFSDLYMMWETWQFYAYPPVCIFPPMLDFLSNHHNKWMHKGW